MTANEFKEQLNREYPYRIELHAHTKPQSRCSEIEPEELAETYKNLGYDGVCVTNHFMGYNRHIDSEYMDGETKEERLEYYLSGYKDTKKAGEKIGLKVYLGLEIRFSKENENDYLIYGVDDEITDVCYDNFREDLATFRKNVPLPKSVFIQAHPMRNGMEQVNPELLDGMETFNMHPGHNASIGKVVKYAKENNLKITTAGGDYHHKNRGHEGVSAIRTKVLPADSFELAEVLKSGDYLFEVGGNALVLP